MDATQPLDRIEEPRFAADREVEAAIAVGHDVETGGLVPVSSSLRRGRPNAHHGVSFTAGPMVRIHFPPAASPVRTALLRHFEENAEFGFLVIRFSMPRRCVRLISNQIRHASRHWARAP
jgi:hypothetical protein